MLKRTLAVCAFLFASGTHAAIWTDIWWNPAESGWGVNVVQQKDVMFLTFYVYAQDGSARWYSASVRSGAALPNGYHRYDGDLYETHGPFFGGVFNPSNVTARPAGSASFIPKTVGTATLSYSVDGVVVTKAIERTSFNHIPLSGSYFGGYSVKLSTCSTVPIGTWGTIEFVLSATVNPDQVTGSLTTGIAVDGSAFCMLAGTYHQYGSVYQVANIAACPAGVGQINYSDVSSTDDGIDGNMTIVGFGNCAVGIGFSAVRR